MTLMPLSGTLLLTILVLYCWATEYIPSSVAALACLSSFYSLLLIFMMPLLQSAYELGRYSSIRSVPASSAWMLPIGVCASLLGFMPYLEP